MNQTDIREDGIYEGAPQMNGFTSLRKVISFHDGYDGERRVKYENGYFKAGGTWNSCGPAEECSKRSFSKWAKRESRKPNAKQMPGPELDAKLATAFGWEYFHAHFGIVAKKPDGTTLHPHFSTTWEGMRLVTEEMQRRGWDMTLRMFAGGNYQAIFGIEESGHKAYKSTAPHAVALAAIKALGGEQGGGSQEA